MPGSVVDLGDCPRDQVQTPQLSPLRAIHALVGALQRVSLAARAPWGRRRRLPQLPCPRVFLPRVSDLGSQARGGDEVEEGEWGSRGGRG